LRFAVCGLRFDNFRVLAHFCALPNAFANAFANAPKQFLKTHFEECAPKFAQGEGGDDAVEGGGGWVMCKKSGLRIADAVFLSIIVTNIASMNMIIVIIIINTIINAIVIIIIIIMMINIIIIITCHIYELDCSAAMG